MNLRLQIYELVATYRLDASATRRLLELAGLGDEPPGLPTRVARAVAVLAAALGGFGVLLWVAANWESLGRLGRFVLLQAFVVAMCAGAFWRPAARLPLALLALLGVGGLLAHFGQTYQTGADPWQLFAFWAALALPLCLAARNDVLWLPWTLVTMIAIALWAHAHTGHRWRVLPDDLLAHALAWGAAVGVTVLLSPAARKLTGAGRPSMRGAVALASALVTLNALGGLLSGDRVAVQYPLGLLVLSAAAACFARRRSFDVFALSTLALGIDVLLIAGLGHRLLRNVHGEVGVLLIIGAAAAGLLAASVSAILHLAKRYAGTGTA